MPHPLPLSGPTRCANSPATASDHPCPFTPHLVAHTPLAMDLQDLFLRINLAQGKQVPPGAAGGPLLESTNYNFMRATTLLLQKKVDYKRKRTEPKTVPLAATPRARLPSQPRHPLRLLAEPRASKDTNNAPKTQLHQPVLPRKLTKSRSIPAMGHAAAAFASQDVFSRLYPGPPLRTRPMPQQARPPVTPPASRPTRIPSGPSQKVSDLSRVFAKFDRDVIDTSHEATLEMKTPLKPHEINVDSHQLTIYERGELLRCKLIYYIPTARHGTPVRDNTESLNYGFDDIGGNYIIRPGDHIDYRYEICLTLGTGLFGTVVMARDHKITAPPRYVAIKIIKNDLQWLLQLVREIKTLKQLGSHDLPLDHILAYIDHFNFRSHMCIVTELLLVNLYLLLEMIEFRGLALPLIRDLAHQLILGVQFIHKNLIIHCDIKPENIMLRLGSEGSDFTVKLIDFGTLCPRDEISFTYIQLRYYRAPEVILGATYGPAIDMWSIGCVLAEMYTGYPLLAGKSEVEQCGLILELLGPPRPGTIIGYRRLLQRLVQKLAFNPEQLFSQAGLVNDRQLKRTLLFKIFDGQGRLNQGIFAQYLANAPATKRHFKPHARPVAALVQLPPTHPFVLLLARVLTWGAAERATPDELLTHAFFQQ